MVKTVMQELHHTILAIAACKDAGDQKAVLEGLDILKNLARSFRIKKLEDLLDHQDPTQPALLPLLNAVADWHHAAMCEI